jgi:hypothetical protein
MIRDPLDFSDLKIGHARYELAPSIVLTMTHAAAIALDGSEWEHRNGGRLNPAHVRMRFHLEGDVMAVTIITTR